MSEAKGIKEVAYVDVTPSGGIRGPSAKPAPVSWFDCAGGGQVVVERGIAYVGNMRNPARHDDLDVKDPKHPKMLARGHDAAGHALAQGPRAGRHHGDNREILGARGLKGEVPPDDFQGGLGIYDVSNPSKPKLITNWKTR